MRMALSDCMEGYRMQTYQMTQLIQYFYPYIVDYFIAAHLTHSLDCFEPLCIKQNKQRKKAWVCTFTCITIRVIHLELMENMTSEQFLLALRVIVTSRGKPNEMILDNAPHFKVTKNTIDILWENVISNLSTHTYLNNERIKWTLILELSPWIEGFYARIIGITKTSLRKSIGKLSLTSSQLQTALSEVEAIVNTIPLTYVDNELKPRKIITPMHFLSMNPKIGSRATANDHEDDPDTTFTISVHQKTFLKYGRKVKDTKKNCGKSGKAITY